MVIETYWKLQLRFILGVMNQLVYVFFFYINIFLVLYIFARKFILVDEPIWKGHTEYIGNNELFKYNM